MFICHFKVSDFKSGSVVFQTTLWDSFGDTIAFSFPRARWKSPRRRLDTLKRLHDLLWNVIRHLPISHNAPCLPPKILHKHCFQFLLGRLCYPGEVKNKRYAKFGGGGVGVANKVHYGRCATGVFKQLCILMVHCVGDIKSPCSF